MHVHRTSHFQTSSHPRISKWFIRRISSFKQTYNKTTCSHGNSKTTVLDLWQRVSYFFIQIIEDKHENEPFGTSFWWQIHKAYQACNLPVTKGMFVRVRVYKNYMEIDDEMREESYLFISLIENKNFLFPKKLI